MGKLFYLILIYSLFVNCIAFNRRDFIPPKDHFEVQILSGGKQRKFLYLPPDLSKESNHKWVMILHGGGGSPEGMIYLTRASEIAKKYNAGVIYPEGYENRWNDGRNIKNSKSDQENINDVQFLDEIVDYLNNRYGITILILAGLSNGGFMTYTYSCESDTKLNSVLSVAAPISSNRIKSCKNKLLPDYAVVLGKKDKVVPFEGGVVSTKNNDGTINHLGMTSSYLETLQWYQKINQCQSISEKKISNKSSIYSTDNCSKNKMNLYLLNEMDHVWPGGFYYRNQSDYGFFKQEISATDWIEKKLFNKNIGD
jgi:polyhydroxybutyrate depolymerase